MRFRKHQSSNQTLPPQKKNTLPNIDNPSEFYWLGKLYLPSLANSIMEKSMFCPSCGRQNKDTAIFCEYCGKVMPQKTSAPQIAVQPVAQANPNLNENDSPKPRLSFNAKRGIVTVLLIVVVVLVVLAIYYPSIFNL
jgi:zinc-ribbon domain